MKAHLFKSTPFGRGHERDVRARKALIATVGFCTAAPIVAQRELRIPKKDDLIITP